MKKKFFAVALATTMALSTAVTAMAADTESLTGTKWWEGKQVGKDYTLEDGKALTLSIEVKSGNGDEGAAFSVEAYDTAYFFTTGSDGNGWFAEGAAEGSSMTSNPFKDAGDKAAGSVEAGKTYEVTVTRSGKDFKMVYYNVTDAKELYTISGTAGADAPSSMKVHVMAQLGTVEVSEKTEASTEAKKDDAGAATATSTEAKKEDGTTKAADSTTKATDSTTKSATKTSPKTGDAAPIAALGAVAVVACAGVVVSRRKVTE